MGVVVCDYIYRHYDDLMEGELTKIKSVVVSRRTCARIAEDIDIGALLRMGKGMVGRAGPPPSVLAGLYESVIGAIYLDGGFEAARDWILHRMEELIREAARSGHQYNFKSVLQQVLQQQNGVTPQYVVLDEQGPDHAKCFQVCVEVDRTRYEPCWAPSKKEAEQDAALNALLEMGYAYRNDRGEIRLTELAL
jgi:ribonuclease-3